MDAEVERRVIGGWTALEHGDIAEARAALQDIYTADPSHPALPLLAAGIRRARPKQIPWRGIVLVFALISAGVWGWRSWSRSHAVAVSTAAAASVAPPGQLDPPIPTSTAAPVGTSGRVAVAPRSAAPVTPSARAASAEHTAPSDEVVIRQAVSRFAAAYSTKWTPLTFPSCEIAFTEDSATATCQSQVPANSGAASGTWIFTCQKIADTWKIVRMQPPPDLSHE